MSDEHQPQDRNAQALSLDERMHAFYIGALFGEGRDGWSEPFPNPRAQLYRVIAHQQERQWSKGDEGRLRLWLKRHFPDIESTVSLASNGMIATMPRKMLDTWQRDGVIGMSHAGDRTALKFMPEKLSDTSKLNGNNPKAMLEHQLRSTLLSGQGWTIMRGKGSGPSYAERNIIVPQALASCLEHHETGERGEPTLVASLAEQIFHVAHPNTYIRFFPERARDGSILLKTQINTDTLLLMKTEDSVTNNVASLATARATRAGVRTL